MSALRLRSPAEAIGQFPLLTAFRKRVECSCRCGIAELLVPQLIPPELEVTRDRFLSLFGGRQRRCTRRRTKPATGAARRGSLPRLRNGSTATDGLAARTRATSDGSTAAGRGGVAGVAFPGAHRQTGTGRVIFLRLCTPPSSNTISRRSRTSSGTRAVPHLPRLRTAALRCEPRRLWLCRAVNLGEERATSRRPELAPRTLRRTDAS